jgi:hypothetical protein
MFSIVRFNHGMLYKDEKLQGFTGKWKKKDGEYEIDCLLNHLCPNTIQVSIAQIYFLYS